MTDETKLATKMTHDMECKFEYLLIDVSARKKLAYGERIKLV